MPLNGIRGFSRIGKWRKRLLLKKSFWEAFCSPDKDFFSHFLADLLRRLLVLTVLACLLCMFVLPAFMALEAYPWIAAPCFVAAFVCIVWGARNEARKRPVPWWTLACLLLCYAVLFVLGWHTVLVRHQMLPNPSQPVDWKPVPIDGPER